MKTAVIVQARVGSTRLPNKVLLRLGHQTVLSRVVDRLRMCTRVSEVVVATTNQRGDDAIIEECARCDVRVVRGSEKDVLARYHRAATESDASEIIRVTSDCPLIDPKLVDRLIKQYQSRAEDNAPVDYISNVHPRTFPHGLDVEMFSMPALEIAFEEAKLPPQREHVTPYFYQHPERFVLDNLTQPVDQSAMRWTLDEPMDFVFLQAVFRHFTKADFVTTDQVLDLLQRYPELGRINSHVKQKQLRAA